MENPYGTALKISHPLPLLSSLKQPSLSRGFFRGQCWWSAIRRVHPDLINPPAPKLPGINSCRVPSQSTKGLNAKNVKIVIHVWSFLIVCFFLIMCSLPAVAGGRPAEWEKLEQLARVGPQPSLKLGPHFSLECIIKCRTISAWFHSTISCVYGEPGHSRGQGRADGFWWTSPANLLGVESLRKK